MRMAMSPIGSGTLINPRLPRKLRPLPTTIHEPGERKLITPITVLDDYKEEIPINVLEDYKEQIPINVLDDYKEQIPINPLEPYTESIPINPLEQKSYETYVGSGDTEEGAFQPMWDKGKTRREISDEGAEFNFNAPRRLFLAQEYLDSKGDYPLANPKTPDYLDKEAMAYADKAIREGAGNKVGGALKHDELFSKYPELKDINLSREPSNALRGSYDKDQNRITVGGGETLTSDPEESKSTALHELQHAIQEKEGWARGGSPESEANMDRETLEKVHKVQGLISDSMNLKDSDEWVYNSSSIEEILKTSKADNDIKEWALNIVRGGNKSIDEFMSNTPYRSYQRLAGEIEARDTQSRQAMPQSERMRTQPYASQGIPLSDVLVKKGGGVSQSAGDDYLYHGTSKSAADKIRKEGFKLSKEHGGYSNTMEDYTSLTDDINIAKQFSERGGYNVDKSGEGEIIKIGKKDLRIANINDTYKQGEGFGEYIDRMKNEGWDAVDATSDKASGYIGKGEREYILLNQNIKI